MSIRATDRITVTVALQLAESAKLEQAIKANLENLNLKSMP